MYNLILNNVICLCLDVGGGGEEITRRDGYYTWRNVSASGEVNFSNRLLLKRKYVTYKFLLLHRTIYQTSIRLIWNYIYDYSFYVIIIKYI